MPSRPSVLLSSDLPYPLFREGKVRDVYDLDNSLLIIATDRISAFDRILPDGIPSKGKILTGLSLFWFDFISTIIENHIITSQIADYPDTLQDFKDILQGRSMLVKKARPIEIECVVRGYITGSAWKEYTSSSRVAGIELPQGLIHCQKLPEPLFTPAAKSSEITGHDINISEEEAAEIEPPSVVKRLKEISLAIYQRASQYAESRGIIIADTKFEFGYVDDKIIIIDEVLTPDSSRFWPSESYKPGQDQPSFDKQYVRDFLEASGWNKEPPAPSLPPEVIERTTEKYVQAFESLTGTLFTD